MSQEAPTEELGFIQKLKNQGTVVIVLVALLTLFTVAFLLYLLINGLVGRKKGVAIRGTEFPRDLNAVSSIELDKLPNSLTNGNQMSISFWLYIHDPGANAEGVRTVFRFGNRDTVAGNQLVCFLEKNRPSMFLAFNPEGSSMNDIHKMSIDTLALTGNSNERIKDNCSLIRIPYLPSKRWVNVTITVDERSTTGAYNSFVDGEFVSQTHCNTRNIGWATNKPGQLIVGGLATGNLSLGSGFPGLFTNMKIMNYVMSSKEILKNYQESPSNSLLAKLGLPPYGVRSPVYRLA